MSLQSIWLSKGICSMLQRRLKSLISYPSFFIIGGGTHSIVLRDPVDTGSETQDLTHTKHVLHSCDLFLFRLTFTLSPNLSFLLIESHKSHLLPNSSPED